MAENPPKNKATALQATPRVSVTVLKVLEFVQRFIRGYSLCRLH